MKPILKIILVTILLTPGSFVIPAALIVTITHHLTHTDQKSTVELVKPIANNDHPTHWSYALRKKLKLPNRKTNDKSKLFKHSKASNDNRLLAKLKF